MTWLLMYDSISRSIFLCADFLPCTMLERKDDQMPFSTEVQRNQRDASRMLALLSFRHMGMMG
jgi:hypothetical protein